MSSSTARQFFRTTLGVVLFLGGVFAIAHAAQLNFATNETFHTTSPAANLTVAAGSVADGLQINASNLVVTISATTGGSFTVFSSASDFSVTPGGGGSSQPYTCTAGVASTTITQASGSASYTIVPTGTPCTTPSSTPGIVSFTANPSVIGSGGAATLSWSVSNANSVEIDPGDATSTANSGTLGVNPPSTTVYTLSAFNANGTSTATTTVTVDAIPPSVPQNLGANAVSDSAINLSWSSSTDSGGSVLAGYQIFRNSSMIATTTNLSYTDSGLNPSTSYTYAVTAYDAVGNVSAQSGSASATTQAAPSNSGGGGGGGGGGSAYSIQINGGAATAATTSVTLSLYGTSAYTMEVSDNSAFTGASWIPYATTLPWTLSPGAGSQTIYARFQSVGGSIVGSAEASINLIAIATTSPIIATTPTSTPSLSASSSSSSSVASLLVELTQLESQLAALQALAGHPAASSSTRFIFTHNLSLWSTGNDVKQLQLVLIQKNEGPAARKLAAHGVTTIFGTLTLNALVEFQKAVGIRPAGGYFGAITRAYLNAQ